MGKKGIKKSKKARAEGKAVAQPKGSKYAPHVKTFEHGGETVRVYGDAVPGQDPVFQDGAGVFCASKKFMQVLTQKISKFFKRHDFPNFSHMYVNLEGKEAKLIPRKGTDLARYRDSVQRGEGYAFILRCRDDFMNMTRMEEPLCLLHLEDFTGDGSSAQGRGYGGAKLWAVASDQSAAGVAAKGGKSKKTKREKAADRRAKKRMEERRTRKKIQTVGKRLRLLRARQDAEGEDHAVEKPEPKPEPKPVAEPAVESKPKRCVPPAPVVSPWVALATPRKTACAASESLDQAKLAPLDKSEVSVKAEKAKRLNPEDDAVVVGLADLLHDAAPIDNDWSEPEDREASSSSQDPIGVSLGVSLTTPSGWESMESFSSTSFSSWESPGVSSSCSSESMSEFVLEKAGVTGQMSSESAPFYPLKDGDAWLRNWLENEARLQGATLDEVHAAFMEEQMDSKLGLEYLEDTSLAEFKTELADVGITKKGVVSKLRGAVKRLFA